MKKIFFINGTINSGKTTTARELALTTPNSIFIDGDDHGKSFNGKLKYSIKAGHNYIKEQIEGSDFIYGFVAYPLRNEDADLLRTFCLEKGSECYFITLAPPLETALSTRGNRFLKDWEIFRIKEMYAEGYPTRKFSDLIIDNSKITIEDVIKEIKNRFQIHAPHPNPLPAGGEKKSNCT